MTQPSSSSARPPTKKQLEALRRIAYASKRSFAWPSSSREASREISRMMYLRYSRRRSTR